MFGTMGFSELIVILIIVLIIFGAGRLPQIGEGVGKALKGFRKEVNEVSPPTPDLVQPESVKPQSAETPTVPRTSAPIDKPNIPYVPGPELTPGTTASLLYNSGPQAPQAFPHASSASIPGQVISMEERAAAPPPPTARASYPPLPAGSHAKPAAKRPSAIVNKDAVARVQAQQAAFKAKLPPSPIGVSSDDMQNAGESLGEIVRTFRQAVTDVRNSVDPQMHTIQSEIDAAQKEIQQSIEAAKEIPPIQDESLKSG